MATSITLNSIVSQPILGNYIWFTTTCSLLSVLFMWGIDGYIAKEIFKKSVQSAKEVLKISSLVMGSILIPVYLMGIISFTANLYPLTTLFQVLCLSLSLGIIGMWLAKNRAAGLPRHALFVSIFTGIIFPGIIILSARYGATTQLTFIQTTLMVLFALFLTFSISKNQDWKHLRVKFRQSCIQSYFQSRVFKNGLQTIPHTFSLIAILTLDRITPLIFGDAEVIGTLGLAAILGSLGHAGLAALTSSTLGNSYSRQDPITSMLIVGYISLLGLILFTLLVVINPVDIFAFSPDLHLSGIYISSAIAAVPYAVLSSLLFTANKAKVFTIATPAITVAVTVGYVISSVTKEIYNIAMSQVLGYASLSLVVISTLFFMKMPVKKMIVFVIAWAFTLLLVFIVTT